MQPKIIARGAGGFVLPFGGAKALTTEDTKYHEGLSVRCFLGHVVSPAPQARCRRYAAC
jgi:hypothetical protein